MVTSKNGVHVTTERTLPANVEAERNVLGACLLERNAIVILSAWLRSDMFYLQKHEWIYQAINACYLARIPPDISTVADELRRLDRLEKVGGILYLGELSAEVPTAMHVEHYARIVADTATRRKLIETGGNIAALGYDEQKPLPDTLTEAQGLLTKASDRPGQSNAVVLTDYVDTWLQRFDGPPEGVASGFREYDRLTGGFHASDLVVVAGRPGMGKTALALNVAYNIAKDGNHVLFFSMEMGTDQLMNRLIALIGGLDVQQLMRCQIAAAQRENFDRAVEKLRRISQRIHIQSQSNIDMPGVRWETLRFINEYDATPVVFVDYLQKIRGETNLRDQMFLSVGQVAVDLKSLAKEARCPVVAISSVNRDGGNNNRKLEIGNLGQSGMIEYEADQVLLLNKGEQENEMILELSKHRNGPQGSIPLVFEKTSASFKPKNFNAVAGY